jgi:hypothetical protein
MTATWCSAGSPVEWNSADADSMPNRHLHCETSAGELRWDPGAINRLRRKSQTNLETPDPR